MLVEIPRVPLARIAWSAGQARTSSSRNLSSDMKKKEEAGRKERQHGAEKART
jgi:hypothetical protein